jgi:hypothetical protein
MSQVPDHMTAGQFLPNREDGGLAAGTLAFERLDHEEDLTNSDPDNPEPLFPYKVGASDGSGPSTKDSASTTEDDGWVDEETDADDIPESWEENFSSSDEDDFGGALIAQAPMVRGSAVEKDTSHKRPDAFPEYSTCPLFPSFKGFERFKY